MKKKFYLFIFLQLSIFSVFLTAKTNQNESCNFDKKTHYYLNQIPVTPITKTNIENKNLKIEKLAENKIPTNFEFKMQSVLNPFLPLDYKYPKNGVEIMFKEKPQKLNPIFSNETTAINKAITMELHELPSNTDYFQVAKITYAKKVNKETYVLEGAHGAKKKNFSSLQKAFEFIKAHKKKANSKKTWTIYLNGKYEASDPFFISDNIKIIGKGNDSEIILDTNTGFVLENADVSFENIKISRKEHPDEPRCVPIIYASKCTLNLKDVNLETENDEDLVKLFYTKAFFENLKLKSTQTKYTKCFSFIGSEVVMQNLDMQLKCNSVAVIVSRNSFSKLVNCNFTINAETICHVLELVNSNLKLNKFTAVRSPNTYNSDTCILANKKSKIKIANKTDINIQGFKYDKRQNNLWN